MKISVFGTGYVGLVTGVCFAEMGNEVMCVDVDPTKIKNLKNGISPIYEPGLDQLIKENIESERIQFTTEAQQGIDFAELLIIAVGTPQGTDGSADLTYVKEVAKTIGQLMSGYKVVINKSTVPVGTQKLVKSIVQEQIAQRGLKFDFDVVSNPEFLREGQVIDDCLKPNRVVIGVETKKAEEIMRRLYTPFVKSGNPLLVMSPESSEMTKYAANSLLATKISFMNELSSVCEKVGANIEQVRIGIGSDHRIGPHFIFAGVGYGGSCFPKDVKALISIGQSVGVDLPITRSVEVVNYRQKMRFFEKVLTHFNHSLNGKKIAVWGVSFKPGTDDIREAPAIDLIDLLIKKDCMVECFDPIAEENAIAHFQSSPRLRFHENQYEALQGADCLIIMTEWKSFRDPNFDKMKKNLKHSCIFDGRNIYNPEDLRQMGWEYHSIGR